MNRSIQQTSQNMIRNPSGRAVPPSNTPRNLPRAPQPGQTSPVLPDDPPKKKSNGRKEPTTDEGNIIMKKIRQIVDWGYIDSLTKKTEKIKVLINTYNKLLSWSNEGSKFSIDSIKSNKYL